MLKTTYNTLEEGVNDPAIFKVVFLAGGPGSGKSFIVGKTGLSALGFRIVNSDDIYEFKLKKVGMDTTPENIYSPKGQIIRGQAKKVTQSRFNSYIKGRLGIVVDGTGKDLQKISRKAAEFKTIGYETSMVFINTDLETALLRNRQRERTLPDKVVKEMWLDVQKNLGNFQKMFGQNFYVVDNSEGSKWISQTNGVYKKLATWSKKSPNSPEAKSWISNQKRVSEEADGAAPSGAVIASIPNPAQTVVGQKKKKKSKEIGHILRRYGKPT